MSGVTDLKAQAAAYLAKCEAESAVAWETLVAQSRAKGADRLEPVQTGAGVGLIVNALQFGIFASEEDVLAGKAEPITIVATEDGRRYDQTGWHQGDSDIDGWVYFERYAAGVRMAHGYIDPVSRRLVQSG